MTIVIHGVPKAQPRVKAYRRGSHVGVYTPNTADAWKSQVIIAASAYRERFDVPVILEAEFYLPRPKTRKLDEYCQTKPDIDNLLKSTMDALSQAGIWRDDAQVVAVVASKRYEAENREIGALIKVTALEAEKMPQIKNGGA